MEYMDLTAHQKRAVNACVQSIRAGEPLTRLFGYAGTGKTTVAKIIADIVTDSPVYATYTAQAAIVLGNGAQTIHKILYRKKGAVLDEHGHWQPLWETDPAKAGWLRRVPLLVLDEVSMIDDKMGKDIMDLGIQVLAIGDPAQLPPVKGRTGYFMRDQEMVTAWLTRVVRHQGKILELATDIREHGTSALRNPRYREFRRAAPHASYDQVIVGYHATRDRENAGIRRATGCEEDSVLEPGERIICLWNNYELEVFNGQQYIVEEIDYPGRERTHMYLTCTCTLDSIYDCDICGWAPGSIVPVWHRGFIGKTGEDWLKNKLDYKTQKRAMIATYGYAVTAYKSQGDEWNSVLVINESEGGPWPARNWLYTAVTRAVQRLTVVPADY